MDKNIKLHSSKFLSSGQKMVTTMSAGEFGFSDVLSLNIQLEAEKQYN